MNKSPHVIAAAGIWKIVLLGTLILMPLISSVPPEKTLPGTSTVAVCMNPVMSNGDTGNRKGCGAGTGTNGGSNTATPPGLAACETGASDIARTRSRDDVRKRRAHPDIFRVSD